MREYARLYSTSLSDLKRMPLKEFLRDYQEAAEELEQERKEADRQQKAAMSKAKHKHVRRR